MIKHLGIKWFRLTAFGPGTVRPPGYREERLSEKAERSPDRL